MKCEHCTRKECSKKTKTDDQENASVDVPSPAHENGEKGEFHKLADAKIFLSDCLACDSCVSAEEGVQVSQQNAKDFFRVLNLNKKCDTSKHKVLAVSVCPQSLPYFAAKFSLSVTDASRRLCGFLKSLGVHYVFDTTIAADFSILESQKEFVRRFRQHNEEEPTLPMLTSACPGWVRYAERVLGHPVTPHLCTAKSPQQIMGSLVKDYFARRQNLSPDKIFHVIVAPCYDKKLEALQEDVLTASRGSRGTDCVLTSGEITQMMEQSDLSVRDAALDTLFGDVKEEEVRRHDGASSDGYLAHIFRHAAKELFNEDVGEVTYRALRNKDFQEVTLEKSGEVLLRFAAAYGFRNIQNVVLKLKKGKFPYHFVEVLACAGGCLNGRGQAQTEDGCVDKALLQKMKGIYTDIPVRLPETSAHVQELYQEWLDGTDSPRVQEALHTAYQGPGHPANSRDIKW
ncbi:nuclear prelamin A recognition factor isoform X1 [Physeter macrocephalus]|uniref:Nuclear prelamin A recognition factor n=1 Tax=Physeter macrocephalus TaxID=9755 RepID=A0A2Y9FKY0_PHYMC|nr:nuclear prelamin A recognition factor isoform X1 [Physeter catodon]XP_058902938.1 nuclear prelamin A recognition factor isoform X1 [Kogia breviceps]|eukprot:XP_007125651.1 nuclear prelamin A recognition factor isoform X1 [Physeter catodon]